MSIPKTLLISINFVLHKFLHPQVHEQSMQINISYQEEILFPGGPSKLHLAYTWFSVYVDTI